MTDRENTARLGSLTDQNWDTDSIKTLERDCVNVV